MRFPFCRHITLTLLLGWSTGLPVNAEEIAVATDEEKILGQVGDKIAVQIGNQIVYKSIPPYQLPAAREENPDKVLSIIGDKVIIQSGNDLKIMGSGMTTNSGQYIQRIDEKGLILQTTSGNWQYYTRPGVTLKKRTLSQKTKLSCDEGREKIQACFNDERYLNYFTDACLAIQDNNEQAFQEAQKGMSIFKNALSTPTRLKCLNDIDDNNPPKIKDYITWQ